MDRGHLFARMMNPKYIKLLRMGRKISTKRVIGQMKQYPVVTDAV
jgi:hypothetical protein